MNQDEIIEMARAAGLATTYGEYRDWVEAGPRKYRLVDFAKLVAAKEREACAKVCEKQIKIFLSPQYATGQPLSSFRERHAVASCVEAIRARGE
jgi:hypothetical protein